MNNTQKIVSNISGYEPYESFSSAQDDMYYELETRAERFDAFKELN